MRRIHANWKRSPKMDTGAQGELIEIVAERLSRERVYRPERAREILEAEVARQAAETTPLP